MIELVFLACLGTGPATICADKGIVVSEATAMACMMAAQPELAKWLEDNPGWEIRRWTCQPLGAARRA